MPASQSFQPIDQNIPLSKKVEEQLREALYKNVYSPGDRLPSENELVEIFGISRTAIRQAIHHLVGEGLLRVERRKGVFVTEIEISSIVTPFALMLNRKFGDKSHLYLKQARLIFEPEIAKLAAVHRTDDDIKYLESCFEDMIKLKNDRPKMIRRDIDFHRRLSMAANNPILPLIMEPVFNMLGEFISENFRLSHAPDGALKDHEIILRCVKESDPDKAYESMVRHMMTAEKHELEMFKQRQSE